MATSTLTATNHYTTFLNTEMSPTSAYAWKRTDLARQGAYHDKSISTDKGESQLGIIQFSHGLPIHPSQITTIKIKATYSGGSGAARKIKFYQSLKSLDTGDNNGSHYLGSELGSYDIGATNNTKTVTLTSGTLFNNLKKYICRGSTESFAICTYNKETCGTSGTTYSTNYIGLKAVSLEVTYTTTSYTITVDPAGGTMTYLANGSTTTSSTTRSLNSTVPYFPISTDGVSWGISITEYNHANYQGGQFICGQPSKSGYTFNGWSSTSGTVTKLTNVTIGGIPYGAIYSLANPGKNVTITAVWKPNTVYYTVTYNANGGSGAPSSQKAAANTNITLSTTSPTRSGYTFLGWSTSSKAQKDEYHSGDSYKVTANCTLYAVWAKNISLNSSTTVTVGYSDDLQRYIYTPSSNVTAVIRSDYTGSNNPWLFLYTKKGVNGGGTWIDGGGTGNNFRHSQTFSSGQPYVFETCFHNPQTGSFTFYFGSIYTITFEKNTTDTVSNMPGTYNSGTKKYTDKKDYGFSYTIPNVTPTRAGYTFLRWSTNSSGTGSTYTPNSSYSTNKNLTLYAIWGKSNYTITFDKNTTDSVSNMPGTYDSDTGKYIATKTHGTDYWIPSKIPTRNGYTFLGWGDSPTATTWINGPAGMTNPFTGGTYTGKYTQDDNYTYYAIWSLTPNTNHTTATLSAGGYQEYLFLPSTTKEYSFFTRAGTSSNKLDTKLFIYSTSGTLLEENDDDLSNELNSSEDNNWNALIRTTLTARTMYKIRVAWHPTNFSGSGAIPFTVATSHTITLNPQGGSVSPSSLTGWFGREYSDCGLSYDMFSYPGYFVTALSTNKNDPASAEITPSTTRINTSANHTVYACWTPESFTITLNNQSATSAGTASVELLYSKYWYSSTTSEQITKITKPTKTGYYFGGYYTGTRGTGIKIIDDKGNMVNNKLTFTTTDTTLYAKWTAKKLTVTYHKNNPDGTTESTATQTFTYDSVGTRRFGYVDDSNNKIWTAPNNYAASYGFGEWYFPGYKIIGWGDNRTAVAYTGNAPYTNVSNNWINTNVGDAATGTKDIYAIWDYNGVVRIYHDGEWKYAIPYIYNGSSWQYGVPYVYKNSTDGWKIST